MKNQYIRYTGMLFIFLISHFLYSDYPLIQNLNQKDPFFRQLQLSIEEYYKDISREEEPSPVFFFVYILQENDDIFSLSARLNLPYDTLASINGLNSTIAIENRKKLIIPSMPGIFINNNPESDLEMMIRTKDRQYVMPVEYIHPESNLSISGQFAPGEKFTSLERAFFLGFLFRFPLPAGKISSQFGYREDPFTSKKSFHKGIDIAAPFGTAVFSAGGGIVMETGYNDTYGNYVIIDHLNDYKTVYGHLSVIEVSLNEKVQSGTIIGRVGSTGLSTGPHLHFELWKNGEVTDPMQYLKTG